VQEHVAVSRARNHVLAAAALALVAALGVSAGCSKVLGLSDLQSGPRAVCETIGRCRTGLPTDACEAHLGIAVERMPTSRQAAWLRGLDAKGCAESCNGARRCLDQAPLCLAQGYACAASEECCGFSAGLSACDPHRGRCCVRRGVRCTSDADCCAGAGACEPTTGTCGGVVCEVAGAECASGFDCCSGICDVVSATCAAEACYGDGFDCQSDDQCCSRSCDTLSGTCVTPSCGVIGSECGDGRQACCSGLHCYKPDKTESTGVCSKRDCFPDQYDCSTDDECCPPPGETKGFCHPKFHLCRAKACASIGGACKSSVDCCDGNCFEGTCQSCATTTCTPGGKAGLGDCCQPKKTEGDPITCAKSGPSETYLCKTDCSVGKCDHDPCTVGTPLGHTVGCGSATKECLKAICDADSYCCCQAWDQPCINAARDNPACALECGL
jgi:hypothetical protein